MIFIPPFAVPDRAVTLLTLLIVGHVFADFLVQTARVAREKEGRPSALAEHGVATFATHLAFVAPFFGPVTVLGAGVIALLHTLQDAVRASLPGGRGRTLGAFFADQAVHLAVLVVVWWLMARAGAHVSIVIPHAPTWLPIVERDLVIAAGFVFNVRGGSMIVERVLARYPEIGKAGGGDYAMGRVIGYLERLLVFALVLLGQWAALGLVVAAKSIARFRELESQAFSDYYLIGTLTSILVAVASGVVVRALL